MSKPIVTSALISSRSIGAGSIAAYPGVCGAFISVHTHQPSAVQCVPRRALAPEGPVRVDATTSLAHVGTDLAFVQVLRKRHVFKNGIGGNGEGL